MNKLILHFLYFSSFFILFYIESISIGGVKIAVMWKVMLIGYILAYFLVTFSNVRTKKFIFYGYLYSLKNFFTISTVTYFMGTVVEVIKSSFIPLLVHYFINISRKKNIDLYKVSLTLSVYVILSSIPFLLGLIEPLTKGYDLSLFGLEAFGFIGIFQVAHAAAVTIAFALLVIMYAIQNERSNQKKIFYFFLIFLGIWVEIQTFARTGFAIVILGGAYLFLMKKKLTFYLKLIPILIILASSLYTYYLSSDVLQMRVGGTNKYLVASSSESNVGSGRLKFMEAAIINWKESGEVGLIMGLGIERAKDLMQESVGLRIYAHNGFIDVLQFNGILGLLLYLLFLYFLYKYIKSNEHHQHIKLVKVLTLAYMTSMFFQGEHFFLADVLFTLSLALISTNGIVLNKKDNISRH